MRQKKPLKKILGIDRCRWYHAIKNWPTKMAHQKIRLENPTASKKTAVAV
jgi:hypothetical protein